MGENQSSTHCRHHHSGHSSESIRHVSLERRQEICAVNKLLGWWQEPFLGSNLFSGSWPCYDCVLGISMLLPLGTAEEAEVWRYESPQLAETILDRRRRGGVTCRKETTSSPLWHSERVHKSKLAFTWQAQIVLNAVSSVHVARKTKFTYPWTRGTNAMVAIMPPTIGNGGRILRWKIF